MQDNHPIAFESRKLNETERRYTYGPRKGLWCIASGPGGTTCLGLDLWMWTDNVATSYFQSKKKLSPKQARWQDFLGEFDFSFEYKRGKANSVADALSRKAELATISRPESSLVGRIREGLSHDPRGAVGLEVGKESTLNSIDGTRNGTEDGGDVPQNRKGAKTRIDD